MSETDPCRDAFVFAPAVRTTPVAPPSAKALPPPPPPISALANPQDSNDPDEVAALERLIEAARRGHVVLQLTMAYERDFERWDDDDGRRERLRWLAAAPPMRRAPGVVRLDVSRLDAGDVLGGDDDVQFDRQLREALRPALLDADSLPSYEQAPGASARLFSDLDHLIAHRRSGARWFVTLDERTILSRADALKALGIEVRRPSATRADLR